MKNPSITILAVAVLIGAVSAQAAASEVAGKVADQNGASVSGVAVSIKNQAGHQIGSVTSDSAGRYAIHDLAAGTYTFVVNGQTAVAYVGADGLTVDWGIAQDTPPIAIARRGIDSSVKVGDKLVPPISTK